MKEEPCADSSGVYLSKRGVESQWGEVSANSDQRRTCASGPVWNNGLVQPEAGVRINKSTLADGVNVMAMVSNVEH